MKDLPTTFSIGNGSAHQGCYRRIFCRKLPMDCSNQSVTITDKLITDGFEFVGKLSEIRYYRRLLVIFGGFCLSIISVFFVVSSNLFFSSTLHSLLCLMLVNPPSCVMLIRHHSESAPTISGGSDLSSLGYATSSPLSSGSSLFIVQFFNSCSVTYTSALVIAL